MLVQAVDNVRAGPDEVPKALLVTLQNPIGADDIVWVNGRLGIRNGSGEGELELQISGDRQRVEYFCRSDAPDSVESDYLILAPGDSLTRFVGLDCFRLEHGGEFTVFAVYRDSHTVRPPEMYAIPPRQVQGPVYSNTTRFVLAR